MAASEALLGFVREALARGLPRAQVEDALRQAGWQREQVSSALAAFAAVEFPIPVPRPRPSLSAREAFMYLLLFATLYAVALNLGSLVFQLINRAFPDPADPAFSNTRDALRFSVSLLIVGLPVFLSMSRFTARALEADPNSRTSPVRRWLTYLTLFVAACVLIGDAASLIYSLLGGELTVRFVLKSAVVGAIAGTVFWYYLTDLRREEAHEAVGRSRTRALGWLVGVVVSAVVVAGLVLLGSPAEERARRLDDRRVQDLMGVSDAITAFWGDRERLPASLEELEADQPWIRDQLADPSTGGRYEYRALDLSRFELCATFEHQSTTDRGRLADRVWAHVAGRQCFARDARIR